MVNESCKPNKFSSISTVAQRLSTGLLSAGPIVYLSRGTGQTAQQVLQRGGLEAQRKLADVSHKIAGPIVVKLHHEFLASKERSKHGLLVGGEGLGYPRISHSARIQPKQGGARLRHNPVKIQVSKLQGGASQKPVSTPKVKRSSLPGGRGLGTQRPNKNVVRRGIPSSARLVKQPAVYEVQTAQGGTTLTAPPRVILKRKSLPGGFNLGVQKVDMQTFSTTMVQGGAGLLLNSQNTSKKAPLQVAAKQGGASQKAQKGSFGRLFQNNQTGTDATHSSFGSVTVGRRVYESYVRF